MDPSQDNPIVRFKAFFWALAVFALFGIALGVIALLNRKAPSTLEDVAAVARYENIVAVKSEKQRYFPTRKSNRAKPFK